MSNGFLSRNQRVLAKVQNDPPGVDSTGGQGGFLGWPNWLRWIPWNPVGIHPGIQQLRAQVFDLESQNPPKWLKWIPGGFPGENA